MATIKTTRGSITRPQESYIKSLRAKLTDEQVQEITGMTPLELACTMGQLSMADASRIIDAMKAAGRKPATTQTTTKPAMTTQTRPSTRHYSTSPRSTAIYDLCECDPQAERIG